FAARLGGLVALALALFVDLVDGVHLIVAQVQVTTHHLEPLLRVARAGLGRELFHRVRPRGAAARDGAEEEDAGHERERLPPGRPRGAGSHRSRRQLVTFEIAHSLSSMSTVLITSAAASS